MSSPVVTPVAAPPAAPPPVSLDAALTSRLTTQPEPEASQPEQPAVQPPVQEPGQQPQPEQPGQEQPQQPDELVINDDFEVIQPDPAAPQVSGEPITPITSLPAELKTVLEASPQGKQVLAAYSIIEQMSKPPDEGGIGRIPSVTEIRNMHQDALALEAMTQDVSSGDPDSIQRFLGHWLGDTNDPSANQVRNGIARNLIPLLSRVNPTAAREINDSAVMGQLAQAYRMANTGHWRDGTFLSDEARRSLFNAAHYFEMAFRGTSMAREGRVQFALDQPAGAQPNGNGANPETEQLRRQLAQERQQNQQARAAAAQQQERAIADDISSRFNIRLETDADRGLEPIKARLSPRTYAAFRNQFLNEIRDAVARSPELNSILNERKAIARSGATDRIDGLVNRYQRVYADVMKVQRRAILEEAATLLKTQNQQNRAALENSQQNRTPSVGGGRPSPQPVGQAPVARQASESGLSALDRVLDARLTARAIP